MSKLKLSAFDLYGTFRLDKSEITGIEPLVHKLNNHEYLSRNADYYPSRRHPQDRSFRHVSAAYRRLNAMLPMRGKPAFVVCEKMYELAIRTVNAIQQREQTHLFQDGQHFDTVAQQCAQACADNLVRLIHGQTAVKTALNLHDETRLTPDVLLDCHLIEADNIKQLFMCANALPDDTAHLITPGCGSSKLGTLVQAVRQHKGLKPLGFTQIYYSRYDNQQGDNVFTKSLPDLPEKVLVMDDIIYRGETLTNIKTALTKQGHQVTNGAITATFYHHPEKGDVTPLFCRDDWAHAVDIIPNQYATIFDQLDLKDSLFYQRNETGASLADILDGDRNFRNSDGHYTADYYAMRLAEEKARALGADLYQVSAKISPAAVAYNQRFRAQVEKYNTTRQDARER